jgi:hypothetical protein
MSVPLSVAGSLTTVLSLAITTTETIISIYESAIFFLRCYGIAGPILWLFGDRGVWRIQMQVLESTNELDAMEFKKLAQDDSNIIAVAVSDHTLIDTVYSTDWTCIGHYCSPDRYHCAISDRS